MHTDLYWRTEVMHATPVRNVSMRRKGARPETRRRDLLGRDRDETLVRLETYQLVKFLLLHLRTTLSQCNLIRSQGSISDARQYGIWPDSRSRSFYILIKVEPVYRIFFVVSCTVQRCVEVDRDLQNISDLRKVCRSFVDEKLQAVHCRNLSSL